MCCCSNRESRDDVDSRDKGCQLGEPTGRDFKAPAQATGDICIPDAAGIESHAVKTSIQSYRLSMAQGQRQMPPYYPNHTGILGVEAQERNDPSPSRPSFNSWHRSDSPWLQGGHRRVGSISLGERI